VDTVARGVRFTVGADAAPELACRAGVDTGGEAVEDTVGRDIWFAAAGDSADPSRVTASNPAPDKRAAIIQRRLPAKPFPAACVEGGVLAELRPSLLEAGPGLRGDSVVDPVSRWALK
jgi:hypothetical protein